MSSSNKNTPFDPELDRKWERLVEAVDAARLKLVLEEIGDDVDAMSKEEIQQVVRRVEEESGDRRSDKSAPSGRRGMRRRVLRVGLPMSLLALAAAGVTTIVFIQRATWTLSYADAVRYSVDTELDLESRNSSVTRVFNCLKYAIEVLKTQVASKGHLADESRDVLRQARELMAGQGNFNLDFSVFDGRPPLLDLVAQLVGESNNRKVAEKLDQLRPLVRIGVLALVQVGEEVQETFVSQSAGLAIQRLALLLDE